MDKSATEQRRSKLLKLYDQLDKRRGDWCKVSIQETNITNKYANIELYQCQRGFHFNNWELDFLQGREPIGHCRLQFPKNAVGVALGIAFAPAYVAGNKVDVRLSSTQEGLATIIEESFHNAKLPDVKILREDPKKFIKDSFNGGYNGLHVFGHDRNITPWTKSIEESITNFKLEVFAAELTGKDFFIVLDDADVDKAAMHYVFASSISSGQVCMSPEGAFVHESIKNSFIKAVQKYACSLVVGNPNDPSTDIGPLMSKSVYMNAISLVSEAKKSNGAKVYPIVLKFTDDYQSFTENLFIPDIVEVADWDTPIMREESFCPQFVVAPFRHIDSVIDHLVSLDYGLTCSIYGTRMLHVIKDRLNGKIGTIFENEPFYEGFDIHRKGWGGFKKSGWAQYMKNGKLITEYGPKYLLSLFSKPGGDIL